MDEQSNGMESEPLAEARLRHQLGVQSQQINRVLSHHHVPAQVSGGVVRPRILSFDIQTQLAAGLERVRGLKDDLINALGVSDVAVVREEGQWRLRVGRPDDAPVPLVRLLKSEREQSIWKTRQQESEATPWVDTSACRTVSPPRIVNQISPRSEVRAPQISARNGSANPRPRAANRRLGRMVLNMGSPIDASNTPCSRCRRLRQRPKDVHSDRGRRAQPAAAATGL